MAPVMAYVIAIVSASFCALTAFTLITTVRHFDPPDVRSWPHQY